MFNKKYQYLIKCFVIDINIFNVTHRDIYIDIYIDNKQIDSI